MQDILRYYVVLYYVGMQAKLNHHAIVSQPYTPQIYKILNSAVSQYQLVLTILMQYYKLKSYFKKIVNQAFYYYDFHGSTNHEVQSWAMCRPLC